jgi:aminopeptidase N
MYRQTVPARIYHSYRRNFSFLSALVILWKNLEETILIRRRGRRTRTNVTQEAMKTTDARNCTIVMAMSHFKTKE